MHTSIGSFADEHSTLQSAQFDRYRRRIQPVFVIEGIRVVLHPLYMVSVALDQLGDTVGSLQKQEQIIADALDELLTRSWG